MSTIRAEHQSFVSGLKRFASVNLGNFLVCIPVDMLPALRANPATVVILSKSELMKPKSLPHGTHHTCPSLSRFDATDLPPQGYRLPGGLPPCSVPEVWKQQGESNVAIAQVRASVLSQLWFSIAHADLLPQHASRVTLDNRSGLRPARYRSGFTDVSCPHDLQEEAKQRSLGDIIAKAPGVDAATLKEELVAALSGGFVEAGTVKGLINQIWDRAIADESNNDVLAEMCHLMPANFDPPEGTPAADVVRPSGSRGTSEKRVDFRLMMIKKCKEELEKGTTATKALKISESRETGGKDGKLKGDEKAQFEADKAARVRMLSAITFTGHLYNHGIATEKLIQACMETLLKGEAEPRHEDVLLLCSLTKLVGMKLEAPSRSSKDGKTVNNYFERIAKMKADAVTKDISKRLDEVLTLRAAGWA
eukprot:gene19520-26194_t